MGNAVSSFEVWRWPEFKAFAERLGIPYEQLTTALSISIGPEPDDLVRVVHHYQGEDRGAEKAKPEVAETTTLHNENSRTFRPAVPHPDKLL